MKKLIIAAALLLVATAAYAASDLMRTPATFANQVAVQFFAPDGANTKTLTVNSSTQSLSDYILYSVYSGSGTCFMRLMPLSTSTKASYTAVPIANTTWTTFAKNNKTPFANMSGCVSGKMLVQ